MIIKTSKRLTYTVALVLMVLALGLSGTAFATLPETEVYAEDIIEDYPAAYETSPDIMHDIDEVGQPEVPTGVNILMQWEKEGYPEDIGGFYYDYTAGSYGVLVVDPSPQRMTELREVFGGYAVITPCKYSYNELLQVQREITEIMFSNTDSGIYGCGIGWTSTGRDVHGFGESGKEFRVTISVDESVFDHYNTGFANRYDDRVFVVEAAYPIALDDMDGGIIMEGSGSSAVVATIIPVEITGVFVGSLGNGSAGGSGNNLWLWIFLGVALLCSLALLIRYRRSLTPAMQAANGGVITANTGITNKQIISAIKDSGSEPSEELFHRIMVRVDAGRNHI